MERVVTWLRVFPPTRAEHDQPSRAAPWLARAIERLEGAGGSVLGAVGASVAALFDVTDVVGVIGIALELLDDAETAEVPGHLQLAIGIATGVVDTSGARPLGSPIDRAQLLANRARKGELVLDATTRDLGAPVYLFGRSVGTGAAAHRGSTIDRKVPRRSTCRASLALLGRPGAPSITQEQLAPIERWVAEPGCAQVALRGPTGAGAGEYLRSLAERVTPGSTLRVANVPGGFEPFGSLRLALLRRRGSPDLVRKHDGEVLGDVARGEPRAPGAIRDALVEATRDGWILVDPVTGVDVITMQMLQRVADTGAPSLFLLRLGTDAGIPPVVADKEWRELVMPALRGDDAKEVARHVLPGTEEDVIRRVAVLGGDTVVGVLEATRTLVAAGDLVVAGDVFTWRAGPRAGVRGIPLDDLLEERLGALEDAPLRLLESICSMPQGTPRLLIAAIADRDGIDSATRRDAVRLLQDEGYATRGEVLQPTNEMLRKVVLRRMPPARQSELCRFAAESMEGSANYRGKLVGATIGFYLAEGGDNERGAAAMLRAAEGATESGLGRSARRLAAVAVQLDPRGETRARAVAISRGAGADPDDTRDSSGRVSQVAIHALLSGDLETVERTVDTAIAEGRDLSAADRVRAMALLAKGDVHGALAAYGRMRQAAGDDPKAHGMASLTYAWIQLHLGEGGKAVRAGLRALSAARAVRDPRGEAAALHTLAACYRSMERGDDAARLSEVAPD